MTSDAQALALRARWIVPVEGAPIDGGTVTIRGYRIESVGAGAPDCHSIDLGDVAIVPGFVNAHTHLEFSDLGAPLGRAGMALPEWIRLVVAHRRAADSVPQEAIACGLRECLAQGVVTVGEIATTDWRTFDTPVRMARPDVTMFHEAIAPVRERVDAAVTSLVRFLDAPPALYVTPGLSPHAPYTVHRALLSAMVDLSRRQQVPLAMHLAESPQEIELLSSGGGPLRAMLEAVNAWDPDENARCRTIREYLEQLALAPRALVVHGNFLADDDLAFLAEHRATMSVVYCGRTHRFFGHAKYPLAGMLAAGVNVALGTDSRASNPDLSVLAEMRCAAEVHGIEPATALRLGTLAGASALGLANQQGSLAAGKLANLAIVQLDDASTAEPHESLLAPTARVVATWMRGQQVWAA